MNRHCIDIMLYDWLNDWSTAHSYPPQAATLTIFVLMDIIVYTQKKMTGGSFRV